MLFCDSRKASAGDFPFLPPCDMLLQKTQGEYTMMRLRMFFLIISFLVLSIFPTLSGCAQKSSQEYGVFLGMDEDKTDRLSGYRLVVIEPSEFSADRIAQLQADGTSVYGYLNIGSVEEFRPYFDRFQDLTLGVYENWPEERWIDVSSPVWQTFIVDELGRRYADLGLDGFFLDNADVYYQYPSDEIYDGLCSILKGLKSYDLPLLINGGDPFVSRCMAEGKALSLFDGINQETVFTKINFDSGTYSEQPESETEYFQSYLAEAKKHGLSVYLLEYSADEELAEKIDSYCKENGFFWYNAEGLELQ